MQQIADIFKNKKESQKGPAYQWQDLALHIIKELAIPQSKKNSVFKVCKDYDKNFIEKCVDDTKELAQGSGRWRYFFKLISEYKVNGKAREGGLGYKKAPKQDSEK